MITAQSETKQYLQEDEFFGLTCCVLESTLKWRHLTIRREIGGRLTRLNNLHVVKIWREIGTPYLYSL